MDADDIAKVLAEVARANEINCTGPGEVGCKGRSGWHSWSEHRAHVAQSQAAVLAPLVEQAKREGAAEAWFDGYDKGNLDGYFGTSDERAKSPYADLDPYRAERVAQTPRDGGGS